MFLEQMTKATKAQQWGRDITDPAERKRFVDWMMEKPLTADDVRKGVTSTRQAGGMGVFGLVIGGFAGGPIDAQPREEIHTTTPLKMVFGFAVIFAFAAAIYFGLIWDAQPSMGLLWKLAAVDAFLWFALSTSSFSGSPEFRAMIKGDENFQAFWRASVLSAFFLAGMPFWAIALAAIVLLAGYVKTAAVARKAIELRPGAYRSAAWGALAVGLFVSLIPYVVLWAQGNKGAELSDLVVPSFKTLIACGGYAGLLYVMSYLMFGCFVVTRPAELYHKYVQQLITEWLASKNIPATPKNVKAAAGEMNSNLGRVVTHKLDEYGYPQGFWATHQDDITGDKTRVLAGIGFWIAALFWFVLSCSGAALLAVPVLFAEYLVLYYTYQTNPQREKATTASTDGHKLESGE